jgi:hypothetical protein
MAPRRYWGRQRTGQSAGARSGARQYGCTTFVAPGRAGNVCSASDLALKYRRESRAFIASEGVGDNGAVAAPGASTEQRTRVLGEWDWPAARCAHRHVETPVGSAASATRAKSTMRSSSSSSQYSELRCVA